MFQRPTVTDLDAQADLIRRVRYGMIETVNGQFSRLVVRRWPKLISWPDVLLLGRWHHRHCLGDRCRLYFNRPCRFPNFLNIPYIVSSHGTSYRTFLAAARALDRVAKIKGTDALLCHVVNQALSDRIMERFGWERHCLHRWGRHFIKRFYGEYPI
jgi:hypothetical protein